eukprot:m.231159 g.231159  ORF g.231159 m.231159 type:complete len:115 (+) comp15687_c0_seq5:45-389(+)
MSTYHKAACGETKCTHTSTSGPYLLPPRNSSGAIQRIVPTPLVMVAVKASDGSAPASPSPNDVSWNWRRLDVKKRLVPKSHTLASSWSPSKTLSDLRSRCTIPISCKYSIARAI